MFNAFPDLKKMSQHEGKGMLKTRRSFDNTGSKAKEQENSLWEESSFRKQLSGFFGNVTLDGVHWIVDTHHWAVKQFWILVVLFALALSTYFSWSVTSTYLYQTSFTVDYSIDNVNVSESGSVPFPAFVICLEAPWDVTKSKELNMSINLLSYMTNLLYPFGRYGGWYYSENNSRLKNELETEYNNLLNITGLNTKQLLNSITVSCEQVVDHCYFGFMFFSADCCSLFFSEPEYGMMGKCFQTTNKYLNFTLMEAGSQSGLSLLLNIENNILSKLNFDIVNYPASFSDGVSFAATNKVSHISTLASKVKGLPPNSLNVITLKRVTVDRSERNSPFGSYQCIQNDDLKSYSRLTPGYPGYTRQNCVVAQKQKLVADKFNCSLIYYLAVPDTDYCGPTETTTVYFDRLIYLSLSFHIKIHFL